MKFITKSSKNDGRSDQHASKDFPVVSEEYGDGLIVHRIEDRILSELSAATGPLFIGNLENQYADHFGIALDTAFLYIDAAIREAVDLGLVNFDQVHSSITPTDALLDAKSA